MSKMKSEAVICQNQRENNYDLLRMISAVAVVVIHATALYTNGIYETVSAAAGDMLILYLNALSRFAVPVFVMLSGAFVLEKSENRDFRRFYAKTGFKTVLPFLLVVLVFTLLSVAFEKEGVTVPLKNAVQGKTLNLWFMYMLCGLYLLTPAVIRMKERLGERAFGLLALALLVWACFSRYGKENEIPYSLDVVVSYLGYFMLGNVIYVRSRRAKPGAFFRCLLLIAALALSALTVVLMQRGYRAFILYFSPTVAAASVMIFTAFSGWNIKASFKKPASLTFYIYLLHTAVLKLLTMALGARLPEKPLLSSVILICLTLALSVIAAAIFKAVWDFLALRLGFLKHWNRLWKVA